MQNNNQQIASAIIIAGVIIAGAILLRGTSSGELVKSPPIVNPDDFDAIKIRPVGNDDHIIGSKDGKIVIIEYSDTECPFCKVFHSTMQQVLMKKSGVAWVYRHFPIPSLHSKAPREAEATECAYEQGGNTAFWRYIDRMFEITPSNDGLADTELTNIAQYVGLNTSLFHTCLESGKYKNKVDADIQDGIKAGVKGTPSSLILVNGKVVGRIGGAQPFNEVMRMLDQIN